MSLIMFTKVENKALRKIFVRKGPNLKVIKVFGALQFYWALMAWRVIYNPKDKPRHFWLRDTELHIMAFSFPFFTKSHGFPKPRNLPF